MRELILVPAVVIVGCSTTPAYKPEPADLSSMSALEARQAIRDITKKPEVLLRRYTGQIVPPKTPITDIYVSGNNFVIASPLDGANKPESCPLSTDPDAWDSPWVAIMWRSEKLLCLNMILLADLTDAVRLTKAIYVLKRQALGDPSVRMEDSASERAFQEVVKHFHSQVEKPSISENARRLRVQAEAAFKAKQYDTAIDLYGQTLALAPWWADGYLNRGLLLAERDQYFEAIHSLRKFLQLDPSGPDARAVQDKIYEWELKLKR